MSEENVQIEAKPQPERYEMPKRIDALEKRVTELETNLLEAFEFISQETRPIYGLSTVGIIFDAVAKRLHNVFGR